MAALPVTPMPTPEAVSLSEGARIVNTFIAPGKTFTDLRRNAAWWAPFLLMVIFSVVLVYLAGQKVGFRKLTENQMQAQPKQQERLEQLPAEQREQQMQTAAKITRIIAYAFPVIQLVILLTITAVLFSTFKFRRRRFVQGLSRHRDVRQLARPAARLAGNIVSAGRRQPGLVHLSESRRHQSWLFPEPGGFAVSLQPGLLTRYFPDLDTGSHCHRLYLREQSEARYGAGHCFRLVAGFHTGGGKPGCSVLLAGLIVDC